MSSVAKTPTIEPRRAKVHITMTTSPTLSLSDPAATLDVNLSARIIESTSPGEPITVCGHRTPFDVFERGEGGIDMFARGVLGGGLVGVDSDYNETGKKISFGMFRISERFTSDALDLKERGCRFLTIPGDGSEVTVTHQLDWERILRYADGRTKDYFDIGERYRLRSGGRSFGTKWWAFGDLEGNLKDCKFYPWGESNVEQTPSEDFTREGRWALSEDPRQLVWEWTIENDKASVEIVE